MTRNDRNDPTDKAHLYRGLGEPPSAHSDPPASVAGPDGLRQHPDPAQAAGGPLQPTARASRPAREELSYDTVRPRTRGGGGAKLLLGAGVVAGAALVYLILKSGIFGAGGGHGGTSPGAGGAAPNPPNVAQTTLPATAPAASQTGVAATAPAAPLHLTIVNETYRVGTADGREVKLEEAVSLAKSAKPGTPVTIDLVDSSRQGVKEDLRVALEQQQVPIIWTRDGKPVTGELPGPGKVPTPGDTGDSK
jgi:hypothetical protein